MSEAQSKSSNSLIAAASVATSAVSALFSSAPKKKRERTSVEKTPAPEEPAEEQQNKKQKEDAAPEPPEPTPAETAAERAAAEEEKLSRTIFVGNLPVDTKPKAIKKHFSSHGQVEGVRLRAAAATNPKMSQRAAVITGELSGDTLAAYVVFAQRSAALAACAASGQLGFGRHLRIDTAAPAGESSAVAHAHDIRKSVFLGNLPHAISEETLWKLFASCGKIAYVRLIREPHTQIGKGFGYVGFHEAGSVEAALQLHGTEVAAEGEGGDEAPTDEKKKGKDKTPKGRPIRVFRCTAKKSNARLQAQAYGSSSSSSQPSPPRKGSKKQQEAFAAKEAANAKTRNASVGWQSRVRRRLHKKLVGRQEKQEKRVREKAASSIVKTITKATQKGNKKAPGEKNAKQRREAKAKHAMKQQARKQKKMSAAKEAARKGK